MKPYDQAYKKALAEALEILRTTSRPFDEEMHDFVEDKYLLSMFPGLGRTKTPRYALSTRCRLCWRRGRPRPIQTV